MSNEYFAKCVIKECISKGVEPSNIISTKEFDFFNVCIYTESGQLKMLVDYWESEGFSTLSFSDSESEQSNEYVLILTNIPSKLARVKVMASYIKGIAKNNIKRSKS